jgi:hypothetical protein
MLTRSSYVHHGAEAEAAVLHDIMDASQKRKSNFFKQTNTVMFRFQDEQVSET